MANKKYKYIFESTTEENIIITDNIKIKAVNNIKLFKDFFDIQWIVYCDNKYWIPMFWSEIKKFFKTSELFWTHSECILYIVYKNNKPVGRIAAIIDNLISIEGEKNIGYFGFFECINDYEIAKSLFDVAKKWLKDKNINEMQGPVNCRVDIGSGFLLKGFDSIPYLLGHYSQPYYEQFAEKYGMQKEKDLVSYHIDLSKPIPKEVEKLVDQCKSAGIKVRKFNRFKFNKEMKWWLDTIMEEFSDHWGYGNFSEEEIRDRFGIKQLRWIIDPKLFLIAQVDSQSVGFRVSLPDYNILFKKFKGKFGPIEILKVLYLRRKIDRGRFVIMGIKKKYRGKSIGTFLNYHILIEMKKRGYKSAEYGWIDETNIASCKAGEKIGGELYKKYRVYKYAL
jgi:hypothetical protein